MSEMDPLIECNDDDDDDEEVDPFRPDSSSNPGPSGEDIPLTTMNQEKEKEPTTTETSFIEGSHLKGYSPQIEGHRKCLKGYFQKYKQQKLMFLTVKKGGYR